MYSSIHYLCIGGFFFFYSHQLPDTPVFICFLYWNLTVITKWPFKGATPSFILTSTSYSHTLLRLHPGYTHACIFSSQVTPWAKHVVQHQFVNPPVPAGCGLWLGFQGRSEAVLFWFYWHMIRMLLNAASSHKQNAKAEKKENNQTCIFVFMTGTVFVLFP